MLKKIPYYIIGARFKKNILNNDRERLWKNCIYIGLIRLSILPINLAEISISKN